MAYAYPNATKEKTTAIGLNDFTFTGGGNIADLHQGMLAALNDGDVVYYEANNGVDREIGQGTWNEGTSTLVRTRIIFSTQANAKINFASPPTVIIDVDGEFYTDLETLRQLIKSDGTVNQVIFTDGVGNLSWGGNISQWDTAFSWDDHSTQGYLTSESDPIFGASAASSIIGTDITNWNNSYTHSQLISGNPHAVEGTELKSTGEVGGTKFLREDGDGTCSWQAVATSLTIGNSITSGTANRVLYENASNQLAESANFTFDGNAVTIVAGGISSVPITAKGFLGQTANLQEWQDSAGTALSRVDPAGTYKTDTIDTPLVQYKDGTDNNNNPRIVPATPVGSGTDLKITGANRIILSPGYAVRCTSSIIEWAAGISWNMLNYDFMVNTAARFNLKTNIANTEVFDAGSSRHTTLRPYDANYSVIVKGHAAQVADLQQWQNSSGTVLAAISGAGKILCDLGTVSTNTFIGGGGNTTASGGKNFGMGTSALVALTTGTDNVAIGSEALSQLNTGIRNTAIGSSSLKYVLSSQSNTMIGWSSGSIQTGNNSVGIGSGAFQYASGGSNVAIGAGALSGTYPAAGSQLNNTAVGYQALKLLDNCTGNIGIGYQAGNTVTTGQYNLLVGYDVDVPSASTSNFMTIGNLLFSEGIDGAGTTVSTGFLGVGVASPQGRLHVKPNATTNVVGIFQGLASQTGNLTEWQNSSGTVTSAIHAPAAGASVQVATFGSTGTSPTALDNDEGYISLELADDVGSQAEFARLTWKAIDTDATSKDGQIQLWAPVANTSRKLFQLDGENVFMGNTLNTTVSGTGNVAIGKNAGKAITTGVNNFALGQSALTVCTTGPNNTAIGADALQQTTGFSNVGIGQNAGGGNVGGGRNVAIGVVSNIGTSSGDTIAIGYAAISAAYWGVSIGKDANVTSQGNVAIGYDTDATHTKCIVIGAQASSSAANQCLLGGAYTDIRTLIIGLGPTNATPQAVKIQNTDASGTDAAGANLTVAASRGTGSGTGGHIAFQTAWTGSTSSTDSNVSTTILELTDDPLVRVTIPVDAASNQVCSFIGNAGRTGNGQDGDEAYFTFELDDDAGNAAEFGRFTWKAIDTDATSKDGQIQLHMPLDNTSTEFLRINKENTIIGGGGKNITDAANQWNVCLGYLAGNSLTTGIYNMLIGAYAGNQLTGNQNVCIGKSAGQDITTGGQNLCVGQNSGRPNATGIRNTCVGDTASTNLNTDSEVVAIGYNTKGSYKSVAIGTNSSTTASLVVAVGPGSSASATRVIAIGDSANAGHANTICVGASAVSSATNQCVLGGTNTDIRTLIIGLGPTNATPQAVTIQNTDASGTDVSGSDLTIAASRGTGTGVGGHLVFKTAAAGTTGSSLNSLATLLELTDDSKIGLYGATPVVQHSSTGEATGFTAGSGTGVNDDSTFTGNVGSTAYRINDIVKALKNLGVLAP